MMDFCRADYALPPIYFEVFFRSAIQTFEREFTEEYPNFRVDRGDMLDYFTGLFRRKLEAGKSRIRDEHDVVLVERLQYWFENYCADRADRDSAWVIKAYRG